MECCDAIKKSYKRANFNRHHSFENMALSKASASGVSDGDSNMSTISRINKLEYMKHVDCNGLDIDEIVHFVTIKQKSAVSIEIIKHLLGGPNMEYPCMDVEESFVSYHISRNILIETLQKTKREILFFEDHQTTNSNILVAVIKKPRLGNSREHIVLWAAIRFTMLMEPKVGFCRSFDITCKSCFMHYSFQKQIYG